MWPSVWEWTRSTASCCLPIRWPRWSGCWVSPVVLMDDDPLKIAKAIRISRKCIRIVYENIAFALIVKALCLLLVAVGAANMWAAIFGDVGVMVIAVLNAIRALRVSKL